jgi:hypothetical protein
MFNVESGDASFGTQFFEECDCSPKTALQYECNKCGISIKNKLTIKAGDGDGVYATVLLLNDKNQAFASLTYFDQSSELANTWIKTILVGKVLQLDSFEYIFAKDLEGFAAGNIFTSSGEIRYSDAIAGYDSGTAVSLEVSQWIPGGIDVVAFCEILPGDQVDVYTSSNGMEKSELTQVLKPRVILLVSDAYKSLLSNVAESKTDSSMWRSQLEIWSKMLVQSNLQGNFATTAYWNGRMQNEIGVWLEQSGFDSEIYMRSFFREFSWYLQAAEAGDEDAGTYVKEMIDESGGELAEEDLLNEAHALRGMRSKLTSRKSSGFNFPK